LLRPKEGEPRENPHEPWVRMHPCPSLEARQPMATGRREHRDERGCRWPGKFLLLAKRTERLRIGVQYRGNERAVAKAERFRCGQVRESGWSGGNEDSGHSRRGWRLRLFH